MENNAKQTIVIQIIPKVIFHSIIKFPSFWRVCNQLKSLPDKRKQIPHLNYSDNVFITLTDLTKDTLRQGPPHKQPWPYTRQHKPRAGGQGQYGKTDSPLALNTND